MNAKIAGLALALLVAVVVPRLEAAPPLMTAAQQFERIKALDGRWSGTNSEGKTVTESFATTSGGKSVMQMLKVEGWPEKPTLYYQDGSRLMLTHYCSAGNQPRMVADGGSDTVVFTFLDATNLASPEDGHMVNVVFHFSDQDHMTQRWTWHEKGRDVVNTFQLQRLK